MLIKTLKKQQVTDDFLPDHAKNTTPTVAITPKKNVRHSARSPKGVVLMPLADAIALMKLYWPALFDGEHPRLLQIGLHDELLADIASRGLPVSRRQLRRCLKSITRSNIYPCNMVVGAYRHGIDGKPVSLITEDE